MLQSLTAIEANRDFRRIPDLKVARSFGPRAGAIGCGLKHRTTVLAPAVRRRRTTCPGAVRENDRTAIQVRAGPWRELSDFFPAVLAGGSPDGFLNLWRGFCFCRKRWLAFRSLIVGRYLAPMPPRPPKMPGCAIRIESNAPSVLETSLASRESRRFGPGGRAQREGQLDLS